MQRFVISVSSVTYAIKGREALRKKGFKANMERKININGNAGCGYAIVVYGNKEKIINTLINSGVTILDIKGDI